MTRTARQPPPNLSRRGPPWSNVERMPRPSGSRHDVSRRSSPVLQQDVCAARHAPVRAPIPRVGRRMDAAWNVHRGALNLSEPACCTRTHALRVFPQAKLQIPPCPHFAAKQFATTLHHRPCFGTTRNRMQLGSDRVQLPDRALHLRSTRIGSDRTRCACEFVHKEKSCAKRRHLTRFLDTLERGWRSTCGSIAICSHGLSIDRNDRT